MYCTEIGGVDAGRGSWTWDGQTISGGKAPDGTYTFSVVARDRNGDLVDVMEMIQGEIDGMSFETGSPVPSIDGVEIDLGDVLEVLTASDDDDGGEA